MAQYWWQPKLDDVDAAPSDASISTPGSVDTPAAVIRDLSYVASNYHPLASDNAALYGVDAVLVMDGGGSGMDTWIFESINEVSLLSTDAEIYAQGVVHLSNHQVGVAVRGSTSEDFSVVYRSRAGNPREQIHVLPFSSLATNSNTAFSSSDPLTFRFRANGSSLSGVLWDSLSADEPSAWSIEATATGSHAAATGYPGFVIQVGRLLVASVGIGTDGDPAPTGPLDVSAEPFRLRHNPILNKVIPVLSFPTVTDIGATCVRPRVTKGF